MFFLFFRLFLGFSHTKYQLCISLGCNLLGQYFTLVEQNHAKGYNVFKHSCDKFNYGKSCNEVGIMKLRADGTKKDVDGAIKYLEKSCNENHGDGCFHLGQTISGADENFTKENNITPKPHEGLKILEKACHLGCADACYTAHSYIMTGVGGIRKDLKKGFELVKKGCDSGYHFESCENLMIMYRKGIGTPKDLKKATEVQEKVDHYREQLIKQREMNLQRTE